MSKENPWLLLIPRGQDDLVEYAGIIVGALVALDLVDCAQAAYRGTQPLIPLPSLCGVLVNVFYSVKQTIYDAAHAFDHVFPRYVRERTLLDKESKYYKNGSERAVILDE